MATGTVWNLPNYEGELYTADSLNTPFLSMIGGLNGGLEATNFEFPTASLYDLPAASQPGITENQSLTAPDPTVVSRTQEKNVCQIFQEAIEVSYVKLSSGGRLSGINNTGGENPIDDERAWQIAKKIEKIARDIEHTFLQGAYQLAEDADTANKSRGMLTLCAANNTVDAESVELTQDIMNELFLTMATSGAVFRNVVVFANGFQKQRISEVYGYAPDDRNVGGVNVRQIETDFGLVGVVFDRFMPTTSLLAAELSVCAPVYLAVPEKGHLFYEELSKTGASEKGQIFGQIGLDHGPGFMHGSVTNLLDA